MQKISKCTDILWWSIFRWIYTQSKGRVNLVYLYQCDKFSYLKYINKIFPPKQSENDKFLSYFHLVHGSPLKFSMSATLNFCCVITFVYFWNVLYYIAMTTIKISILNLKVIDSQTLISYCLLCQSWIQTCIFGRDFYIFSSQSFRRLGGNSNGQKGDWLKPQVWK